MNCKIVLFLVALLPSLSRAQGDSLSSKYCVRYVNEHLYYNQGDEMNVIDIEVEWPEVIDGQRVEPLQQFLSEHIFKVSATTFRDAYDRFRKRFGQPVSHLSQIPSDDKYCYVDCMLRLLDHLPGRYVSFVLVSLSSPAKASSQPADTTRLLLTYDLQKQQVLTMPAIIHLSSYWDDMADGQSLGPFVGDVIDHSVNPLPEWVDSLAIDNACLVGGDLLLQGSYFVNDVSQTFNSMVSLRIADGISFLPSSYVTPAARRLIKKKEAKAKERRLWQAVTYTDLPQANGQPVVSAVDEQPSFPGGNDRLIDFLASTMYYPVQQGLSAGEGKCMVEFVVDSEGKVGDISVIEPVSQVVDREAARVVRLMPRWTPGKRGGQPVNTRLKLPLVFAAPR